MKKTDVKSAADFVRENERGFESFRQSDSFDVWQIVETLIDDDVSLSIIVQRLVYLLNSVSALVLGRLLANFEGDQKSITAMASAIVRLPKRVYSEWCNREWWDAAAKVVGSVENFTAFFDQHKKILTDPEHPLYGEISADKYWQKKVTYYIAKRDYVRAWEEIKKAARGFAIGDFRPEDVLVHPEMVDYDFAASENTVIMLVTALYGWMLKSNLVPFVPEMDFCRAVGDSSEQLFALESETSYEVVYETKQPVRRRQVRKYSQSIERAGLGLAKAYFLYHSSGWDEKSRSWSPNIFTREGAMVLVIADWHRRQRNEKRRAKFEKLADGLIEKRK